MIPQVHNGCASHMFFSSTVKFMLVFMIETPEWRRNSLVVRKTGWCDNCTLHRDHLHLHLALRNYCASSRFHITTQSLWHLNHFVLSNLLLINSLLMMSLFILVFFLGKTARKDISIWSECCSSKVFTFLHFLLTSISLNSL